MSFLFRQNICAFLAIKEVVFLQRLMCACNKIGCRSSSTKKAGFVCVSEKPEEAERGEENIKSHSQGINAICKKMQFSLAFYKVETAMQK